MPASVDASTYQSVFGIGADDTDLPPSGSPEDMVAQIKASTRAAESQNVIKNHVIVALSLGLVPLPLFDVALLTSNQINMIRTLARIYGGQTFKDSRLKAVLVSLVSGTFPVASVVVLSSGLKVIPGVGSLVGSGGIAVTGATLTYAIGQVFNRHFESGGTYLTLNMEQARAELRAEINKGRRFVSGLAGQPRNSRPVAS
ncbi:MAG: DUF697 domain-containing protein [Gammaproteobacteria bacterium]|jgi:uncharacterized protein (DUF697 family)|nr:DUF697 domain-containing protein [Gammaproteobacteria bacterium]